MSIPAPVRFVPAREAHSLWARVYDSQPNPVLTLEERYLDSLLPPVNQLDVVDLGCGTGRWLSRLANRKPKSLVGIDSSSEMLEKAKRKLGGQAKFFLGDCENPLLPEQCADLLLCSFVGSYVDDFSKFALQIASLLRPHGSAFFTDLHPSTVAKCGWRRGFSYEGSRIDIEAHSRTIPETLSSFEEAGLQLSVVLEPHFAEPELSIFEKAGKGHTFQDASLPPAIFILQMQMSAGNSSGKRESPDAETVRSIRGARIALGPQEAAYADISVAHSRIEFLGNRRLTSGNNLSEENTHIDLSGFLLLPGLINAHDHLEFALFPRLGKGPYRNFVEWAQDIHAPNESPVREHRAVAKDTRLWWGAIRNLLCGVTTVCHHNPYAQEVFGEEFSVRVLRDYGWAHSVSMDRDFSQKNRETPREQPFIIHLAEGIDEESSAEIFELAEQHALDDRTVIVHGLGLDEQGKSLLLAHGAALVWCPTSNVFLFGRTLTCETIQEFPRLALGSDSPLTAEGDLLDEIRFARAEIGISEQRLFSLVTTSAADLLQLRSGEGTVRVNAPADFFAIRDRGQSPAKTLAELSYRDVELVVAGGRVNLASPQILERIPQTLTRGLELLAIERTFRWIRAPVSRLISDALRHLPGGIKLGGRKVWHAPRS